MNLSKQKVGMTLDISTESVIVLLPVATALWASWYPLLKAASAGWT